MIEHNLISIPVLCKHYEIDLLYFDELFKMGLINIEIIEETQYVAEDQIGHLEKIIRLQSDLNLSLDGIDIVFNLLDKERRLQDEINVLKNKLSLYE